MANPGKNKIQRWARIFVDGFNLSGDARTFGTLEASYDEVDLTGWANSIRNALAGMQLAAGLRGFTALSNDAASGAFTALITAANGHELSVLFGGGTEPAAGDPAYLLGACKLSDAQSLDNAAFVTAADFVPQANVTPLWPWGVVLHPETSISATTNGTSHDNGVATTAGWHAILHITSTSSGNYAFIIQQSTTGAFAGEETTLGTFSIDGSAVGSERLTGTTSAARYIRFKATRTAGTVTPICTFARHRA